MVYRGDLLERFGVDPRRAVGKPATETGRSREGEEDRMDDEKLDDGRGAP